MAIPDLPKGRPRPRSISGGTGWSNVAPRFVSEHHTIKVLLEPQGAIVALTMSTYSYLFILTRRFVGVKKILTRDRIVARAGYSAPGAVDLIAKSYPHGV